MFLWFDMIVRERCLAIAPSYDVRESGPTTLEGATKHYMRSGRLLIDAAHSDTSIYADAATNYAFRAWHDWHHVRLQAPFAYAGELAVYHAQCRDVLAHPQWRLRAREACRILQCEIMGQLAYAQAHGVFPPDQRAFTRQWLAQHGGK